MISSRNFLWLAPLLLALSSPVWWRPAADFLKPRGDFTVADENKAPRSKAFVLQGVVFSQRNKEREEILLNAAWVRTTDKENIFRMETVDAILYGAGQEDRIHVLSGKAWYDADRRILALEDDVRLDTAQGYSLRTSALQYLTGAGQIKTAAPVRVTGNNLDARGRSLFYDLKSGEFKLGGGVSVTTR